MNALMKYLISQFGHPRGMAGRLAGWIMATRTSNLERNEWTVGLVDLEPADRVLEIGPGPGVTLQRILEVVTQGEVTALDHSALMIAQCKARNRNAVDSGRLKLIEGDYRSMADLDGPFDKIIAVNSLQFSGIDDSVLRELRRLLGEGGVMAVTFQPRGANPTNEAAMAFARNVEEKLAHIGFTGIERRVLELAPVNAVCILART